MPFFNGITRAMLDNAHAFASNGPSNTRTVSFGPTPIQRTASSAEADTHFYFGFIAKGDVLHSFGFTADVNSSTEFSLRFRRIGTTDETIIDEEFASGSSVSVTHYYNWKAPYDGVIFFEVDSYRRSSTSFTGILGTAWISRP